MTTSLDCIPDFCRLTVEQRNEAWIKNPPRAFQIVPERPRDAELKEAQKQKSLQRLKSIVPKAKKFGALPADFSPKTYRWNPNKGKWVRDQFMTKFDSGLQITENQKRWNATAAIVNVTLPADFADLAKLKKFAKANDCWHDKYDTLPNSGLVRMNVINRLRAKIKKGYKVVWS